jgi:hypothetical protein
MFRQIFGRENAGNDCYIGPERFVAVPWHAPADRFLFALCAAGQSLARQTRKV